MEDGKNQHCSKISFSLGWLILDREVSGKNGSPKDDIASNQETDNDHGRAGGVESTHDLRDHLTEAGNGQIGQISGKAPYPQFPKAVSKKPVDNGVLVLYDFSGPSIKGGSEHFQCIVGIGGDPYEVKHSGGNQ